MSAIREEERRGSNSVRVRHRTEDDISTWLNSNRHASYVPENAQEPTVPVVRFQHPDDDDSSSSSSSTASSSTAEPIALDGGYGWVIVLISFCIHFICDGLSFSFGVLFPKIQERFKTDKFIASCVGSVFLALPLLAGPIAGLLTDVYDCKRMTIVGGVVAAAGVTIAYFANNVVVFLIGFGFVAGIGLCFCYNTAIVIVTYYFEKRRALATGLAVCGSGFGTFCFPPLIEFLLSYGFSEAMIFFAFAMSTLILLGYMIKDIEWPQDTTEYKKMKFLRKLDKMKEKDLESLREFANLNTFMPNHESASACLRRACSLPMIPSYADTFVKRIEPSASIQSIRKALGHLQDPVSRSKSVAGMPTRPRPVLPYIPEYSMLVDTKFEHLDLQTASPCTTVNSRKNRPRMQSRTSLSMTQLDQVDNNCRLVGVETDDEDDSDLSNDGDSSSSELSESEVVEKKRVPTNMIQPEQQALLKMEQAGELLPSARMARVSVIGPGMTHSRVPASNAFGLKYYTNQSLGIQAKAPSAPTLCVKKKKKNIQDILHLTKIIDALRDTAIQYRELLADSRFSAFLVSIFILYLFFDIPYVNFPEYTHETLGVPINETAWLISGIGIANMVGMVLYGLLADLKHIRQHIFLVYGVAVILAGVCILFSVRSTEYFHMQIISVSYGAFIASNYVLASVLTTQMLCVSDFQAGYGFLCLVEGIANLIGPALVGFVRDQTQSYEVMFLIGGCGTILSGIIVVGIYLSILFSDEKEPSEKDSVVDEDDACPLTA